MANSSTTSTPESRGQIAYTAYGKSVDFTAFNGEPMPMWHELDDRRRQAWINSARVVWDLATTGSATI